MARIGLRGDLPAAPTLLNLLADRAAREVARQAAARAGFGACYDVRDLPAALDAAAHLRPDVCLLDGELVEDLVDALEQLSFSSPETKVVVIAPASGGDGLAVLAAGARGYVPADLPPESLARSLADVIAGRVSVPRRLVRALLDEVAGAGRLGRRPQR